MIKKMPHPGGSDAQHFRLEPTPIDANILVSVATVSPVTLKCLEVYGLESVVLRYIDTEDEYAKNNAMFDNIIEHWTGERDLIHIDHDMLFTWDHLRMMSDCPEMWCACPYFSFGQIVTAPLGFCKFSKELQRRVDIHKIRADWLLCEDTERMVGCNGEWWGVEWHIWSTLVEMMFHCDTHDLVLNAHIQGEYRGPSVTQVDWRSKEGRAELADYMREKMGWGLPNEPGRKDL
jgi:hypothetical protein